jgi:hypothetical protein
MVQLPMSLEDIFFAEFVALKPDVGSMSVLGNARLDKQLNYDNFYRNKNNILECLFPDSYNNLKYFW